MKWNELDYKLSSIHGNEKRKSDNVAVKIVDRNGMLLNYVTKVEYKEDYVSQIRMVFVKLLGSILKLLLINISPDYNLRGIYV